MSSETPTRLEEILASMDVPEARGLDTAWLLRNLAAKNFEHPDFNEAIGLLKVASVGRGNAMGVRRERPEFE